MCGITGLIKNTDDTVIKHTDKNNINKAVQNISIRGKDRQKIIYHSINNIDVNIGFARLAIIDNSEKGDQPFILNNNKRTMFCVCNGEIYNFKELIQKYNIITESHSDCEVLLPLYNIMCNTFNDNPIVPFLDELKGNEFAFCIVDIINDTVNVILATDPCSVRPLFYCFNENYIGFSSTLSGLLHLIPSEHHKFIKRLAGSSYVHFNFNKCDEKMYYGGLNIPLHLENLSLDLLHNSQYTKNRMTLLKETLESVVESMLISDRPLGALLSGGLDSSLVVAIAARILKKYNKSLNTFSIGLEGGTDEKYAKMVANHCGTIHTHILMSNDDFLNALNDVVKITETYDVTTIRASTGQYLISKWIADNTDIKVLLIGDGSDELLSGYMYFHNCPSPVDNHMENSRLLHDIHFFDGLRADRCIAGNNIEARLPFLNYKVIESVLNTDARLRLPYKCNNNNIYNNIEKWFLRKSFENTDYLPDAVLWRKKEAFSDGVSHKNKSWYQVIQDNIDNKYPNMTLDTNYTHNPPKTKEALYYRQLFESYFGKNVDHLIPYYWLPRWCGDIIEPSARILNIYHN